MNPYVYAALIVGGIFLLLTMTLISTHWELLDARQKAKEWEERCRRAISPSSLAKSGLMAKVGGMVAPVYRPFAIFEFTQACEVHEYSLLRDDETIETKSLTSLVYPLAGDMMLLHFDTKMLPPEGAE